MHFEHFRLPTYSLFFACWSRYKSSIFDSTRTKYISLSETNVFDYYDARRKWKVSELLDLEHGREVFQNIEFSFRVYLSKYWT